MPGVRELEDQLILGKKLHFDGDLDEVSKKLFGITQWDIWEPYAHLGEDWRDECRKTYAMAALDFDEDKVAYLKDIGWDFTDELGRPVRVLQYFCFQAEAIARGLVAGTADTTEVAAEMWGAQLEAQVRAYKKQKR
jgi:hypothetical protein